MLPNNNPTKIVMNWSSGKDASLAYMNLLANPNYKIECLLTTMSMEYNRVFMHGVREELIDLQAYLMKMPLIKIKLPASPNDELYKKAINDTLQELKIKGINTAAYGDIFLDDLKTYREQQLETIGYKSIFPLWKKNTSLLINEIEENKIDAIVVCVNEKYLGKEFLGKKINTDFLNSLPKNVDPCGENGEYHTFVYNAPFFSMPISLKMGEIVHKSYKIENVETEWDKGFYFLDIDVES